MSYQVSAKTRRAYSQLQPISEVATACQGLSTSDDGEFVRTWQEVSMGRVNLELTPQGGKWFLYNKGGAFRKWFGNAEHVINWEGNGRDIKARKPKSVIRNERFYFKPSVSWQDYTIGATSFRYYPRGFVFATNAHSAFVNEPADSMKVLCFCNSKVLSALADAVSPGLHFNSGYFELIPFEPAEIPDSAVQLASRAVAIAKEDWDSFERSWNFTQFPLLADVASGLIAASFQSWRSRSEGVIRELRSIEEQGNRLFNQVYGFGDELSTEVADDQLTLTVNSAYRYGSKVPKEDQEWRFREDTAKELVSYAVGCIMGRYSLDEPGLVYAHAGNIGFDPTRYERRFPADADAIVPVTDERWFEDDAATRVREFIGVVWGVERLEENVSWLAESLGGKGNEAPDETIRRYISEKFYRDHIQTYKKRPIFWLFSSGKHRAFQSLVYLHRYNEGTLARMRAEYVVPLIAKVSSRLDMLEKDVVAASSAAARSKLQKQIEALRKKQIELLAYDEKLRHCADMRIALDLDDGVKVNYAKFGDLVAESKAITGGSDE